ncbi:MAG: hypothetical protein FWH44_05180 [Methanomassiliicoccaceae archaeon]|nr:hypothetical protein [Methanomassiliicoccaceae archaeon]
MDAELYHESQTVVPSWAALATAALCITISAIMIYMFAEDGIDADSAEGIALILGVVLTMATAFALFLIRIKVTVTHVSLRVGIIKGRLVPMSDIERTSAEEFSALRDYGGWGIKFGKGGWGYIAAGTDKGIRIHLKDGKSFLISTKRSFEFESAMRMALRSVKR